MICESGNLLYVSMRKEASEENTFLAIFFIQKYLFKPAYSRFFYLLYRKFAYKQTLCS